MKTTRFALTAALAVMGLFAGGCSQSLTMPEAGVSKIVSVKINDTKVLATQPPAAVLATTQPPAAIEAAVA